MKERDTYFLKVWDQDQPDLSGKGEAAPLPGLSPENDNIVDHLTKLCQSIKGYQLPSTSQQIPAILDQLIGSTAPSVRFALESALLELLKLVPTNGFNPIPINGLIWMGDFEFMKKQLDQKVSEGFNCIKIKIGALEFRRECELLDYIRQTFDPDIVLRVDANGAFNQDNVWDRLQRLSQFRLHSIEQPVPPGQYDLLKRLCVNPSVPVALDEELIGVSDFTKQRELLDTVCPQYIVLKPTLLGGFDITDQWIQLADERGIGWWITSALESNVGLNAIAHYTASKNPSTHQGLGTGQLYHNNVWPNYLQIKQGFLNYGA